MEFLTVLQVYLLIKVMPLYCGITFLQAYKAGGQTEAADKMG